MFGLMLGGAAVRSRDDSSVSSRQLNQMLVLLIPAIMCLLGAVFTFVATAAFFPAHVYRAAHSMSGGMRSLCCLDGIVSAILTC